MSYTALFKVPEKGEIGFYSMNLMRKEVMMFIPDTVIIFVISLFVASIIGNAVLIGIVVSDRNARLHEEKADFKRRR